MNSDPKPAISPRLLWQALLIGNAMSLGVLLLVFQRMMAVAIAPQLSLWLLGSGLLLALPAWRYRRRRRDGAQPPGKQSENARQLAQLNQVVVACALAELPGIAGCFYYLFSREWGGTLLLLGVTAVLLLLARPRRAPSGGRR
jgi:hypothetical protein